jgi:succinate dehydrogenase/fumarate reductase flavoprotein subunit
MSCDFFFLTDNSLFCIFNSFQSDFLSNCGGLRVNEKTEVLDTRDIVIDGLYGIGEMTGGVFYHNYPSGTGLVKGAIAGRIAEAEAAAKGGH